MKHRNLGAGALAVLALASLPARAAGPGSLPQELAAARRAGIPLTLRETQGTLPPPEQNAAILYLRIGDVLARRPQSARDFATIESAEPGAAVGERVREALLRNGDVRALVHAALGYPRCVFPLSASQNADAEARQVETVRIAAHWLRAESADLWARGESAQAVATLQDGFAIARHAAEAHTMTGLLAACSIDAMVLQSMDRMLLSGSADRETVRSIAAAARAGYRDPPAAECIVGDATQQLLWAARLKREGQKGFAQLLRDVAMDMAPGRIRGWASPRNWNAWLDAAVAWSLWTTRREMAAARLPYPQAVRAMDAIAADVRSRLQRRDPSVLLVAATHSATRLPAQSLARVQARQRATVALAAVVAWRLEHGTWPALLADAIAPPTDPFDLKPMRYARLQDGFAIWSVGPSGKFDATRIRGEAPVGEVGIRFRVRPR